MVHVQKWNKNKNGAIPKNGTKIKKVEQKSQNGANSKNGTKIKKKQK